MATTLPKFDQKDLTTLSEALIVYSSEIGKLMKKAEKLNLTETDQLKRTYLHIVELRERIVALAA